MERAAPFSIEDLRFNLKYNMEAERSLLAVFSQSCVQSLKLLKDRVPAYHDNFYNMLWKKHMEQIKNLASDLGAQEMSDLAGAAASQYECSLLDKSEWLIRIQKELDSINRYIAQLG